MIDKDANEIANAASSETMLERSIEASEDGRDDRPIIANNAVPSPAPEIQKSTENCDKPSSRRSRASVVPTKLLHNGVAGRPSNPQKSSGNGRSGFYLKSQSNSSTPN
jgi:hypothetical protein